MGVREDKQFLYDFIAEQQTRLNLLYPIADRMIECQTNDVKNDAPQFVKDDFQLVFSDEFTGTSLDPAKWKTSMLWGDSTIINSEEQWYVDTQSPNWPANGYPNPFSFDGDNLGITATYAGPNGAPEGTFGTIIPGGQNYWSGVITTEDSFEIQQDDYIEFCTNMPCDVVGLWAAGWLLNRYYNPDVRSTDGIIRETEIDWEFVSGTGGQFGGGPYSTACTLPAYHWFRQTPNGNWNIEDVDGSGSDVVSQQCDGTILDANNGWDPVCNLGDACDGFHTYGIQYTAEGVFMYMDGVLVRSMCDPDFMADIPMYFIFNQAVGGNFPGPADPSTYPATVLLDYVRIYRP